MAILKRPALRGAMLVSIALVIVALAACSKEKTAADYIHQAQAHRIAGDIPAAIIDLKNALQKNPQNLSARILLGKSYLDLSEGTAAEAELMKAKQEGAYPLAIALPLAEAKLARGEFKDALAEANPPSGASNSLKASLLSVQARANMALGHTDEAQDALTKGLVADPHSIDVLTTMVRFALAKKDLVTARTQLAAAQKEAPSDTTLMLLQGALEYASGDYAGAEKTFKRIEEKEPWNLRVRLAVAQAQVAADHLNDAMATLAVVLKAAPQNPLANYFAAVVSYRNKDYAGAQRYNQQTLRSAGDFEPALLLEAAISYGLKDYDEANSYLTPYVFQHPEDIQARKLLSAVQFALGRPDEAEKTLSPVAAKNKNDVQLLTMLGTAAAGSGDLVNADRYLSEAIDKQPNDAMLRTRLGETKMALGETAAGIDELEKASLEDQKSGGPDAALFVGYLKNKDYDKALALAERIEKSRPKDPTGWEFAGLTYIAKGDIPAGRAALMKALDIRPGDPVALNDLAVLALREGKFDQAAQYFDQIVKANPKNYRAGVQLAEVQEQMGQADKADNTLRSILGQDPDNVAARVVLARLLLAEHKNQEALTTIEPAMAKNSGDPNVLEVAGLADVAVGHADEAVATLKSLVALAPRASGGHLLLGGAYIAAHNLDAAQTEAQTAVQLDPENEGAQKLLLSVLLAKKDFDNARKVVTDLATRYPQDIEVAELDGSIALDQNRYTDAIAAYRRAIAIHDNAADQDHLALAELRAGHVADAKNTLSAEIAAHPDDIGSRMALGNMEISLKEFADAKAQYSAVLRQAPNNVEAENNLAWTLYRLNEPAEALKYARAAAAAAPNAPDVLDTLGVVLMQNNAIEEAVSTLRKAREQGPNNPGIQYHLAEALAASNQKTEARDVLRKLLSVEPAFSERRDAQKLLNELGG